MLINNNIYFCRFEDNGSVRINVFTKDGVSLDHIFIQDLPDKTKLRETILKGTGYNILTSRPNNVYKYIPTGEYKTVAQWITFLSPFILTDTIVKNLYENGDEIINVNPNTNTPINTGIHTYYVNALLTDRIFIYDNTNKLLHITDYIPKGTTHMVTINNTQGISSSVVPVNPLPVPNFWQKPSDNLYTANTDEITSMERNVQCVDGNILNKNFSCYNIYTDTSSRPSSSVTWGQQPYVPVTLMDGFDEGTHGCINEYGGIGKIRKVKQWGYRAHSLLAYRTSWGFETQCSYPSIK